mgnify:CR=1 FL=1
MSMNKIDSFYDFLDGLVVKEDGSFDYDIKDRILGKYNKVRRPGKVNRRALRVLNSEKREAA